MPTGKRIEDLLPYGSTDSDKMLGDIFEVSKNSGTSGSPIYASNASRQLRLDELADMVGDIMGISNYLLRDGGNSITGIIPVTDNNGFNYGAGSISIPAAEYILGNNTGAFGPQWNNIRTYYISDGSYDNPHSYSLFAQSETKTKIIASKSYGDNLASIELDADTGKTSMTNLNGGLFVKLNGIYGGTFLTEDIVGGNKTWQLPSGSGTIALTSDITTALGAYLPLAGGVSMTGNFDLFADASSAMQAVTLQQMNAALVGLWDDRGNYNASGNVFPSSGGSGTAGAILKGDIWTISVAGTLGGVAVVPGDTVRALVDSPGSTAGNWAIGEGNLGYTPLSNTLNAQYIYVGNVSNVATGVPLSGDASIATSGALTVQGIQDKAITLATGYLRYTGSAWTSDASVGVTLGGTGLTTVAAGSVLAYNSLNTASAITSTSGTKVLINTAGTVSWYTYGTFSDATFTLQDDGDATKQAQFQLSGITTGTTRTYTLPNVSDTLAVLGAQSFTGLQTFTADLAFSSAKGIKDSNGNYVLVLPSTVSSAVNYFNISNSASGTDVTFGVASGSSDTNRGIIYSAKGTGNHNFNRDLYLYSGTAYEPAISLISGTVIAIGGQSGAYTSLRVPPTVLSNNGGSSSLTIQSAALTLAASGGVLTNNAFTGAGTGDFFHYRITGSFTKSNITGANYQGYRANPTINQSGTSTGYIALFEAAPTVTSVVDTANGGLQGYRSNIAAAPTGSGQAWNVYALGTAPNYFAGGMHYKDNVLAQITSNQNDYVLGTSSIGKNFSLSSDASRNITGIANGSDGRMIILKNTGSNPIIVTHQDTNSSAANRILASTAANITIAANGALILIYDSSASRWRDISLR